MCHHCDKKKCKKEASKCFEVKLEGAVFTATNLAPLDENGNKQFNGVMMYHRYSTGALKLVPGSPFLTKGQGVGPGNVVSNDPLGTQDSIIVDKKNKYLYVVNAGSNEVSSFKICYDKLKHIQTISSGGTFPVGLTLKDNMLYVVNGADKLNFQGFKVNKGILTPTQKCELQPPINYLPIVSDLQPQSTISVSQIGFTPDGRFLVVARKEGFECPDNTFPFPLCLQNVAGPGRLDLYALDKDLRVIDCNNPTSTINTRSPAGRMPFGFGFNKTGKLIVGEFLGTADSADFPNGTLSSSAVSSYTVNSDGSLTIISTDIPAGGQGGWCWTVVYGKFVYGTHTVNGTISLYTVKDNGELTLINPIVADVTEINLDADALDCTITSNGKFYYILSPTVAAIESFAVDRNSGSLTYIGSVPDGIPLTGQMGLTTCDFKCRCK